MLPQIVQQQLVYQNDLQAKIFLLIVIGLYMVFSFWRYEKLEFDTLSNKILKLSFFIYSRLTLFFYPLMVVSFLHINTTLDEMIIFISGLYTIILVVTFGLLIMKGFEWVLKLLNIDSLEHER